MAYVPLTPDEISASWLNEALSGSPEFARDVDGAAVVDVRHKSQVSTGFQTATLHLAMSSGPARQLTLSLAPAISSTEESFRVRQQVIFFQRAAPLMFARSEKPPLPFCYASRFDRRAARGYALFRSSETTHYRSYRPLPPTGPEMSRAVDALARFQAFWWDSPYLANLSEMPSRRLEQDYVDGARGTISIWLDEIGHMLRANQRRIVEHAIDGVEALIPWSTSGRNYTLRHGLLYPSRFSYPSRGRDTALIDTWIYWSANVGAHDMASLVACHVSSERRRRSERHLVQRYWRGLLENGVADYSWLDCWRDYRMAMVGTIYVPMWELLLAGASPSLWWPMLLNLFDAFEELDCWEFVP